ncbi:hypothetical protein CC1G_01553 [Coprinopsis cinerea okayama7|uniref:Uncharacterized protein n=1 Tax=Coprinopsis cinerea (strain Okayama-7 / 130 / ATCC MYA-4618 / FGSC 9003) TaxID=240176 RepID=A8NI08_COPC7|nr:hypothetical protein CC1G_01553 [Coprinopsis cinerea okayama7\|eukprot:XP_001833876.1 hypothetical protein CC1G_01553 [Coprinopsis cinerea okayama7\
MAARRIDDRDPSIAYSQPAQGHHWTDQGSSTSYGGTLRLTRTRNANARVTFEGTSIQVYGLISPSGTGEVPISNYAIDNLPTVMYTAAPNSQTQSQVLFFDSGPLSPGTHTLIVSNQREGAFFWLDSFVITPNPAPPPASPPQADPPVTQPAPSPQEGIRPDPSPLPGSDRPPPVGSSNPDPAPSPSPRSGQASELPSQISHAHNPETTYDASVTRILVKSREPTPSGSIEDSSQGEVVGASSKGTPVGPIVGGVLGALVLLLLTGFAILFLKRRHRKKAASESQYLGQQPSWYSGSPVTGSHAAPYTSPTNSTSVSGHAHNRSLDANSGNANSYASQQQYYAAPPVGNSYTHTPGWRN